MDTDDSVSKILRWTGWVTWIAVGLPVVAGMSRGNWGAVSAAWWLAFSAFGPALAVSSARLERRPWRRLHVPALVVGTLAPLVMIGLNPECFAGALLVIVAWQVSLQLDTIWALIWVGSQSVLLSTVVVASSPNSSGISSSIIFSVFQFFAFCTAFVTRKEINARNELLQSNSELKTTQLLLSQSTRIGERVRISRELHDVLGHDLTALSLHLEIARKTQDAQHDVEKAQGLAKGLLVKVREVVSLMRTDDELGILPVLRDLAANEPKLRIHVRADDILDSLDTDRAHALLRCLQEAITNARVHSGANNLWLEIYRRENTLIAQAKDDGRGTSSEQGGGHGLTGIRERLKQFGGNMTVESAPGAGFTLLVELPLGYP